MDFLVTLEQRKNSSRQQKAQIIHEFLHRRRDVTKVDMVKVCNFTILNAVDLLAYFYILPFFREALEFQKFRPLSSCRLVRH